MVFLQMYNLYAVWQVSILIIKTKLIKEEKKKMSQDIDHTIAYQYLKLILIFVLNKNQSFPA